MINDPRPYHHGDLRGALVRAALELLERAGPEQLSLRGLAETAGVSRSAPYSHFADKRALLAAIAAVGFERFAEEMLDPAYGAPDARARFLRTGRGYARFALRNPNLFRLMFSAQLTELRETGELKARSDRAYAVFRDSLNEALRESGAPSPASPALQALAWSCIHGLSVLLIEDRLLRRSSSEEVLVGQVTELFTELIAPTGLQA